MVHSLAYPPPSAFGYQQAPPPPPDDTQSHVQPEPMNFNSGNNKNNRGNNFHNANQRGQNRQNWSRGNHRGGNRSGQFSSGFQQSNSHFPNARETHQNQGGQGQNVGFEFRHFRHRNHQFRGITKRFVCSWECTLSSLFEFSLISPFRHREQEPIAIILLIL